MVRKKDDTKRVALRIGADLCKRVDAWRAKWEQSALGVQLSRNQALTLLLERGLACRDAPVRVKR